MAKKKDNNKKKKAGGKDEPRQVSPVTKKYRQAYEDLEKGDLVRAVRAFMQILENEPDSEEAYFSQTQIRRLLRLYPEEMKQASFDEKAFEEAVRNREESRTLETPTKVLVGFIGVAAAWMALFATAPPLAMLGQGPEVPLIFRLLSALGAGIGLAIAYGFMKRKWEAVTFFLVWIPPLLILTFIGVVESPTAVTRILTLVALAAEVAAAWYVSRFSHRFVY